MARMDLEPTHALSDLVIAREAFLQRGIFDDCVTPSVREAWLRCRAHGVDAHNVRRQRLDPERLRAAQSRTRLLLDVAETPLRHAHEVLSSEPHMVALSDPEGLIVRFLAPSPDVDAGRAANLFEGASWNERDVGSNAIGTALAIKGPLLVVGAQHFADEYGRWGCVGIPVRNPDGSLAGALDFSVRGEQLSVQTAGWALSLAEQIEAELARRSERRMLDGDEDEALRELSATVRGVFEFLRTPEDQGRLEEFRAEIESAEERLRHTVQDLMHEQARLEEWDRRKDDALARLAHELSNPLGAMMMLLDLTEKQRGDPVQLDRIAARLRRQAGRLMKLVGDIGDVARVKGGALVVDVQPVDLNHVVRLALDANILEFQRRGHEIRVDLRGAPLVVNGDPDRLEQVVTNLLTNAAKYTPPGGTIDVESGARGGAAVLRIRDTGCGIAPENLERIFDSFTRVVPAMGDPGGMGIGLSLVAHLVQLHGGTITAHSEGLGKGSEFQLTLPLR